MPQFVVVSPERHSAKKWQRASGYGFAAKEALVPIVSAELAKAVLSMPLAFTEHAGGYSLMGVMSLTPGRNMFIAPNGHWMTSYVPAFLRAYPFRLNMQPGTDNGFLEVDEDSGLVVAGSAPGEDFFTADGKVAPATQKMTDFLVEIERSRKALSLSVAILAQAGLIAPWPITVKTEQEEKAINGLFRIDEAALAALSNEHFLKLRVTGALPVAYLQLVSTGQIELIGQLAKLHAQSDPRPLPESLDKVFDLGNDDMIRFD